MRASVQQMLTAYREHNLCIEDFMSRLFMRIARLEELMADGRLDHALRWQNQVPAVTG